jgi:hypothetical protein
MNARILKDTETGKLAVFNAGKSVPVHVGTKYWFQSKVELQRMLRSRGLCWNVYGELFNRQGRPVAAIFSWYEGTNNAE